jgi:hypothetical protein
MRPLFHAFHLADRFFAMAIGSPDWVPVAQANETHLIELQHCEELLAG